MDEEMSDEEMELCPELKEVNEKTVMEHPYTGERFNWKTFTSDPKLADIWKTFDECWMPGHSCRKHWEEVKRTTSHPFLLIPQEKRPLKVFPRELWGAAPASEEAESPVTPYLKVVLSFNTGLEPCMTEEDCKRSVRELQRIHMDKWGLRDIAYNFIVGGDYNIYVGRGWFQQPDGMLKYPQWRHRRLDIAFLVPREGFDVKGHQLDVALEYLNIGVKRKLLRIDHDLYQHEEPLEELHLDKKLPNITRNP